MKLELTIPTTLDEIPLMHYQKFMEVSKNSTDDEFVAQKMIQIFCGIELKEVVKIAFNDMVELVNHFNKLFSEIPKLKPTFKIKDLELGMIPNFDKITWEEYIELESQFKDFDTFHKAMAVLYRPVIEKNKKNQYLIAPFNNVEEFSDLMKYTPLSVALSSHVFFLEFRKGIVNSYTQLFGESDEETEQEQQNDFSEENQFSKQWGWYQSIYAVAKGDVTKFDEVLKTELFTILNFLTFEKQKNRIEINQLKKQRLK